jgi:hypothetical protein
MSCLWLPRSLAVCVVGVGICCKRECRQADKRKYSCNGVVGNLVPNIGSKMLYVFTRVLSNVKAREVPCQFLTVANQ